MSGTTDIMVNLSSHSLITESELAMKARRRRRCVHRLSLLVRLNDGSRGYNIGNRRRGVDSLHKVWTLTGLPEMPPVALEVAMPRPIPPIGMSMGAVIIIWFGLDAQGN
jgi:hypothetical protein